MDFIPFDLKCYTQLQERFEHLFEPALINEICKHGDLKHFEQDFTLIDIGDVITRMPLVISGSIKIMTEDDQGDELLLYYLELGDTCAVTLNCCTKATKSTIKAITEEPCEILLIPVNFMEEWMIKFTTWRIFVLESYNTRLNEMLKSIDNLVFNSMEDRLINYLRDKAFVTKSSTIRTSHHLIANDLHSTRVVISRLMKKLENKGLITQSRGSVTWTEYTAE